MKTTTVSAILLGLALAACGSSNNNKTDGAVPVDAPKDATAAPPAPPTIGAQIDRMGRPGINTAITDPFWNDGTQTVAQHEAKQDQYNAVSDPTMWATSMIGTTPALTVFKTILAVYDGADTGLPAAPNTCGNQLAFGGPLGANYTTLADVLIDDELYVNTASTTCALYLAVEANTLGIANTDCGGRTLTENTIDETYNALVIGAVTGPLTSGVTSDATGTESNTVFPFLGPPNT